MIRKFLRYIGLPVHVWKYRSPYARKCIHCNLQQNVYDYGGKVQIWEDMVSKRTSSSCNKNL